MNLLLHLPPETEDRLMEHSRATGKDVEIVALEVLNDKFARDDASAMLPAEQWHAQLDALLASMPKGNPNADFSREHIYNGRGE